MHPRALLLLAGLLIAIAPLKAGDDSVIKSLSLRRQYLRTHATEDAIVLCVEGPDRALSAVAALTDKGTVALDDGTRWTLPDVGADMINHPDRLRSAIAEANRQRAQAPVPLPLAEAASLLGSVGLGSERFPAAGSRPERLVFDWNGRHITYDPGHGCTCEQAGLNPLTGHRLAPAPFSSGVDALVFVQRYRAAFPSENAVLILPEHPALGERILGGAGFSRDGRLCLYSSLFGAWQAGGQDVRALSDKHVLQGLLFGALRKESHSSDPKHWSALPSKDSFAFADDSPRLELYRLRDALQAVDVPAMVNESVRSASGAADPEGSRLIFEWEGRQFGYMPARGTYDKGPVAAAIRTSFLDDLLFVQAFAAAHPSEQVALLVHPPSAAEADRKRVADALYTIKGRVRLHSLLAGDLPVDSLHPEDFQTPARLQAEASRAYAESRVRHPTAPSADSQPLGLEEAQRRLLAAGIRAALVPLHRRSEEGRLEPVAGGAVRFTWKGETYLYLDNACYAQSRNGPDTL